MQPVNAMFRCFINVNRRNSLISSPRMDGLFTRCICLMARCSADEYPGCKNFLERFRIYSSAALAVRDSEVSAPMFVTVRCQLWCLCHANCVGFVLWLSHLFDEEWLWKWKLKILRMLQLNSVAWVQGWVWDNVTKTKWLGSLNRFVLTIENLKLRRKERKEE